MLKLLATAALGTVLTTGAFAQAQDPATDPIIDPAAPSADAPAAEGTMAPTAEGTAAGTMAPTADGTAGGAADGTMAPTAEGTTGAADGTMAPAAGGTMAVTGDWTVDENYRPVDVATLTAEDITGADIRNPDGEVVATVDDLVLGQDGKAESIAAKFGGFLGFGTNTVLLTLDEVEFMQNDGGTVVLRSNVTPESLEGRPDYEDDAS